MSPSRILTASIAGAALATAATASAAQAPTVSAQHLWRGATAPLTVPGAGLKRGAKIRKGDWLVYREVSISKGQKITFRMTATGGRRLLGLAPADVQQVNFTVVRPVHYGHKVSVLVRAFPGPKAAGRVIGRIYALTR
jgi:hypothetical protein